MPKTSHTALAAATLTVCIALSPQAHALQPKGHITNAAGINCTYRQVKSTEPKYFHDIPGPHNVLTFDDPQCMRATGLDAQINRMLIANNVARNHAKSDAKFLTRPDEIRPTSLFQVRGQCIQSENYPVIGVVIEYQPAGQSISAVRHGPAVMGCTK